MENTYVILSDIEGHEEYIDLALAQNPGYIEYENHEFRFSNPDDTSIHFVFCGDAEDNAPLDSDGDGFVIQALSKFKKENKNNVHLVAGNRELTKLRFIIELSTLPYRNEVAYWLPDRRRRSMINSLRLDRAMKQRPKNQTESDQEYNLVLSRVYDSITDDQLAGDLTPINYIRWATQHTMGHFDAIEKMRKYLQYSGNNNPSDNDIVDGFQFQAVTTLNYLISNDVGLLKRCGSSIFGHGGGFNRANTLLVPGHDPKKIRGDPKKNYNDDVDVWIEATNKSFQLQLQTLWTGNFKNYPNHPSSETMKEMGFWLFDYILPDSTIMTVFPGAVPNLSLVTGSWLDFNGNIMLPDPEIEKIMTNSGIRRGFFGHIPVGRGPSIMRGNYGFDLYLIDTTYSEAQPGKPPKATDRRTCAALTLVQGDVVQILGIIGNLGLQTQVDIPGQGVIGRKLSDGSYVKSMITGRIDSTTGEVSPVEDGIYLVQYTKGPRDIPTLKEMSFEEIDADLRNQIQTQIDQIWSI